MLATFQSVSPFLKLRTKIVSIDNLAFKLHYRTTFLILLVATILVTSRQYIGEHIKCVVDPTSYSGFVKFIETFCFFTTTFTVTRHLNESALQSGAILHPGVGPHTNEEVKHHAYYQWVPFVLFLQAICFYLPHYAWKKYEGGRIFRLVNGLKMQEVSKHLMAKKDFKVNGKEFLSRDTVDGRITTLKTNFLSRLHVNRYWGRVLVLCELANLLNVLFQIYVTDKFLGGQFYDLGFKFMDENWTGKMDFLDVVFPKMTKCYFYKFGPSGSIQLHDALCVMALNIINEKIYTFLWFWYLFVAVVSFLALSWRLLTTILYRKSQRFNGFVINFVCPGRQRPEELYLVTNMCEFSNWLYLVYLASNMDSHVFAEFIKLIVEESKQTTAESTENQVNHLSEDEEHIDVVDYVVSEKQPLDHEKHL